MIDEFLHETKQEIAAHADAAVPFEACGLIIKKGQHQQVFRCRNIAKEPEGRYTMHPDDSDAAEDAGEVLASYHSHIGKAPVASDADKTNAEKHKIPMVIFCQTARTWGCYLPNGWEAPYEGRPFVYGVLDCYTLVQDFYRKELKLILPDIERPEDWWIDHPELDLFTKNYGEHFALADRADMHAHDLILMALKSTVPNHVAIWLGNGHMLHHPPDRLSGKHTYVTDHGYYAEATRAILRHKTLC